ncbi:MAG: phospholipase D-like domain-containing protein [Nanoarchaeota archaeon]
MRIAFPILIVAALILYSCEGLITGGTTAFLPDVPPARPQPQPDIKPADVKIFICPQDDCAGKLADIINSSSNAACALYALTEPRVLASVQDKAVPLVLDQSVADKKVKFEDAIFGPEGHTMHDKFCIIDGEEVITGSHNPTRNKNHDLLITIGSSAIATVYKDEYLEMRGDIFGGGKPTKTVAVPTKEGSITALFCPDDPCEEIVKDRLDRAESSIFFQAFSFTSDAIAQSIITSKDNGLQVSGVTEEGQESQYSQFTRLNESGIPIRLHDGAWLLHRKLFIIDNETIITGSANPTKSGYYSNDENIVIIDDKTIATDLRRRLEAEDLFNETKKS